jgi:hypothetical protein
VPNAVWTELRSCRGLCEPRDGGFTPVTTLTLPATDSCRNPSWYYEVFKYKFQGIWGQFNVAA